MLQQLAGASGAQAWAIGSLLFFVAVFALVAVVVLGRKDGTHERLARLPLEEDAPAPRPQTQDPVDRGNGR